MPAPEGNKFWKARTKHGRGKAFESAELLWDACCEYFQWVEDNPLWENRVAQFQGGVVDMPVAKMRAMTKAGLCFFLGVDEKTFNRYRDGDDEDFCRVAKEAEQVIYQQKFAGAAADLLNANIIARDLGLSEKTQTEHSGSIDLNKMSDAELEAKILELTNGTN